MKVGAITSRDNPLLVRLRKLNRDPNGYRKHGEVLIEGEHLCQTFAAAVAPRHALVSCEAWEQPALRELVSRAETVAIVPAALLAEVSTLDSTPPLAFVIDWPGRGSLNPGQASIVLDRVQDPGNVGSILRSAAAFGFPQVIALAGTAALWSPKVVRAAMGAHVNLALVEVAAAETHGVLDALRVPLIATSSHARSRLDAVELAWPCAWIVGHEGQGVAPDLLDRAQSVRIPQPGGQESLNVGVAAALCMYESRRRAGS